METYNIQFEIASVCFLSLMIIMLKVKRQLNILRNRLFSNGLVLMLALNLFDIGSAMLINRQDGNVLQNHTLYLNYGFTMGSYLLQQVALQLFLAYITMTNEKISFKNKILWVFNFVSVLYYGVVASTPFTKLVFSFSETGVYERGKLHWILYAFPMLYGVFTLILCYSKNHYSSKNQKKVSLILFLVTVAVIALQVKVIPGYLISYFWITIVLAVIFITIQSPDYYLDRTTNAFNHDGLMVMLNDCMKREKPFSIMFMAVHDFEKIQDGFSAENKRVVYKKVCSELFRIPNTDIFRDDDKIYIMFHETSKTEEYAMKIGQWVTDGIELDSNNTNVKIVSRILLFDFPGRIRSEEEFHSVIKYFMTDDYYKRFNVIQFINEEFFRKKKRYEDVRRLVEEAVRTEGIEMYYQPIYSTIKQDFHCAEALVRLRDVDSIGFVSPEEFIPIAEKEHLILQLEDIILHKVCRFVKGARLQELGMEYIEVNLSGNQCMQTDLYEQLSELIEKYNIPPKFINFEVTETSTIDNNESLIRNMRQLQSFGSSFSLDDYGSGASNLKYLVDFPFEIVKLDKSIVWTHFDSTNRKTQSVLPLSISMLREMGVRIVAEGVETEAQKNKLIELGVQYLQGYYFSRPISEMEFICFLKEHNKSA